jgi:hypothetical protein
MTPLVLLATTWLAAEATAAPPPAGDAQAACAVPETDRAPDPRCGEALDGRGTRQPPMTATRAVLTVPRLATQAVMWPIVHGTELVEHYQLIDWMDAILTTDDGLVGVRPIIHYSTSFLPSGGLRLFYNRLPAGSGVAGQFQTAGPDVMLGQLDLRGPRRLGLSFTASWNRRYDRLFAGIGPHSAADLETAGQEVARYGSDNFGAELRWMRPLPPWFTAYGHADLQWRNYTATHVVGGPSVSEVFAPAGGCATAGLPADCVDPTEMPGFAGGLRVAHLGATLGLGLREPGRERRGAALLLGATAAQGVAGDPSRHVTYTGEGIAAVGGVNRVLVLRARAATIQRLGNAPIPFDELISPSGDTGMRGFPDGRFRGQSGLVGTAEYRWFVTWYLDATLFTDVGTVAGPAFTDIDWTRWFPSFGVGFRVFKSPDGPYWDAVARDEIQFAYAPDNGFRMLFSMTAF